MKKQKMIRWLAWAVAGIACVAVRHSCILPEISRKRSGNAVRLKPVLRQKSQEEEDLANGNFDLEWKEIPPEHGDAGDSLHGCRYEGGDGSHRYVAGKGGDADAHLSEWREDACQRMRLRLC